MYSPGKESPSCTLWSQASLPGEEYEHLMEGGRVDYRDEANPWNETGEQAQRNLQLSPNQKDQLCSEDTLTTEPSVRAQLAEDSLVNSFRHIVRTPSATE